MRILVGFFVGCACCAIAQEIVFQSETRLRQVEVRVSDKQLGPIRGLRASDFELRIDGETVKVASVDYVERPATDPVKPDTTSIPAAPPVIPREAPSTSTPNQSERAVEAAATRVLILPEATFATRPYVYRSVKTFLNESWPEGARVAFEGMPFTDDREQLLSALELLVAGKAVGTAMVDYTAEGEAQRESFLGEWESDLMQQDTDPTMYLPPTFDETLGITKYRVFRYRDIVRQLSAYPGKKVVILFRDGLPMEPASRDWWKGLAGEAARYRVSFYTVDSRGLLPGGTGAQSGRERLDESVSYQTALRFRRTGNVEAQSRALRELSNGRVVGQDSGRSGLLQLAEDTGGRAVINSNRLSDVFERLRSDLGGYYLLGYYESAESESTAPRKLRIGVNRPNAKLAYVDRYFSPVPFVSWTKSDKYNHIYHALNAEADHHELPVSLFYEIFAGADGRPVLFFTTGGRMGDLEVENKKGQGARSFSVALRLDTQGPKLAPAYHGKEMRIEAPSEAMLAANSARWSYPAAFPSVSPGAAELRVVVRDDRSGTLGGSRIHLDIPDLRLPHATSSLLLTDEFLEADPDAEGRLLAPLVTEGTAFRPVGKAVFQRGSRLAILYDVYNVSASTLSKTHEVTLLLRHDGKTSAPAVEGRLTADSARGRLRFVGYLDTADLEPGGYDLFAQAPGASGEGKQRFLRRGFMIR